MEHTILAQTKKLIFRLGSHIATVKDLAEAIAENPSDRKRVMQMYAETHVLEQLLDQLRALEEENENTSTGNGGNETIRQS